MKIDLLFFKLQQMYCDNSAQISMLTAILYIWLNYQGLNLCCLHHQNMHCFLNRCTLMPYDIFNSLRLSDTYMCQYTNHIIASDFGLLPGQRQAIIWINAGVLLKKSGDYA